MVSVGPAADVTRRVEWDAVSEFLAYSSERPCALVVEGEAGIGKTTFWLAAREQARGRGYHVLSARPAAAETVLAYAALADLLSAVEPATWEKLPGPQRRAIDRIMLRTTDDDIPAEQRTVAAAFLSVIEELAERNTVVLAIDDLQWLDPSSASVIAFAARRLTGPVGILAAARTGQTENPAAWLQLPTPDAVRHIELAPMTLGALHHVVSQRLGRSIPRPAMVRIHEVSGGNPFYAIELARAIDPGTAGADIRLPATLSELVRARLEGLHNDVQDLLLAAASLGTPTVEQLGAALALDSDDLAHLLDQAEAAGILMLDGQRVRFTHPLLGSGVYTGATAARRRSMHRRLAQIVDEPELRARHLALAATRGDPETLQSLDTAAEIARMRGAPAAAAELVDLAIGLGGDTPQRRIQSAAHHFNAGDAITARTMLQRTIEPPAPAPLRAEARNLLAVMSQLEDSLLDGAEHLQRGLADAGDDLDLRVQILVSLSWIQIHLGQHMASARSIEDAVADATRLGRPKPLSQALGMRAVVHLLLGNGVEESCLQRALKLEDRQAAITVMFRPTVHRALVMAWMGEFDAAHDQFVAVRQSCIDRGEESELVFVAFHSVLNDVWRADFAHAGLIAEDTMERAQQLSGALPLSAALTVRAMVAACAGRENDARRDVSAAIGPISRSGSQLLTAWTVATLGFLEVSLGNYQAAITELDSLVSRVMSAPYATEIFVAWFLPDAVEALTQLGQTAEAEPLVDALERNGRRLDRPWMLAVGGRCRAMLFAAHGELDAASQAVQLAMIEHDRLPMPFERARTQLLLGQIQRRQRQKDVAAATLRESLSIFEQLGTALWADRVRAELARVKVGPRPITDLSPSEHRVAELAASGMTNREVAAALFISHKTVEANLARVYHKLGIHSRAELGRRVGQNTP